MPVFPFDETKFYALTYMLDTLAPINAAAVREIWDIAGSVLSLPSIFTARNVMEISGKETAPVAQWLYPIPKNLRNSSFLSQLTRERIAESILHGVKGTPMPPWGSC